MSKIAYRFYFNSRSFLWRFSMKKWILIIFGVACILFSGCSNQFVKESSFRRSGSAKEGNAKKKSISLVCWNVQTFFDAVTVGTEYKDFKNSERWNKEKYLKRLNKLCDVMTSLNPDIFVMEEIENTEVVQDIANALAGSSWEHKKNWQYACFAKECGSAIGCAVFSRYELSSLKCHSIDIRTQAEEQPSSRPLMQLTVCIGNKELELFVNHWKSKSGGEEETEIWRDWQELVLAEKIISELSSQKNSEKTVVMCGDFNRSAEAFILSKSDKNHSNTLLRGYSGSAAVYSPWFRPDGKFTAEAGSYFYNDEWERIDNILISGEGTITSFSAVTDSPVADEEGIPLPYKVYTGEGCSDHLPLKCVITI